MQYKLYWTIRSNQQSWLPKSFFYNILNQGMISVCHICSFSILMEKTFVTKLLVSTPKHSWYSLYGTAVIGYVESSFPIDYYTGVQFMNVSEPGSQSTHVPFFSFFHDVR